MSENIDNLNNLQTKLAQAAALLEAAFGEGKDNFDTLSPVIRDNYIWTCSDLVNEAEELAGKLNIK